MFTKQMKKAKSLKTQKRKSLLFDEFEKYAKKKLDYFTRKSPKYYHDYKQHTNEILKETLHRSAHNALIKTSKSLLEDYFTLFPFQPTYLKIIMDEVDEFFDEQQKDPWNFDLNSLSRILTLGSHNSKISDHFFMAEKIIESADYSHNLPEFFQKKGYSYDDVFYLPRSELYGHISTQPQSLLYFVTKLNAEGWS